MSVETMTGYFVRCDHVDESAKRCTAQTSDYSDFAFWADDGQALDDWTESDGIEVDGQTFCDDHIPDWYCRISDDHRHVRENDTDETCVECDHSYVTRPVVT